MAVCKIVKDVILEEDKFMHKWEKSKTILAAVRNGSLSTKRSSLVICCV